MRIEKNEFPGAVLLEDRAGPLSVKGDGNLVFSRNHTLMFFDIPSIKYVLVSGWRIQGITKNTRVGRFIEAIPELWRFCK